MPEAVFTDLWPLSPLAVPDKSIATCGHASEWLLTVKVSTGRTRKQGHRYLCQACAAPFLCLETAVTLHA